MRSKSLLVSNILSTLYSLFLLWIFGGAIIAAGGLDYIYFMQDYFSLVFNLIGYSTVSVTVLYVVLILLLLHIFAFTLGFIFAWIGYGVKSSGLAKFSAVLFLIGTLCFPIYIFPCLPLTILAFVGGNNQKKINTAQSNQ